MSSSQHPVALRLEQQVGGATKLLATVMCLPLVDGIFPALVLAGAVDSVAGIVQVGLLVFGGSATVAVILAEMDGGPREQAKIVLAVGSVLLVVAAVEAALAPTIESLLDMATFKRFAALVIAAVAAKTASARVGEYLPRPAVIVGLGLVGSLDPGNAELVLMLDPGLVARATAAAGVGVGFALAVALLAPTLRELVDIDRFRFGSAVALGLLPLSLLGLPFGRAPLAVIAVTALFALDPSAENRGAPAGASAATPTADGAVADGGDPAADDAAAADAEADAEEQAPGDVDDPQSSDEAHVSSESRAPWL